MKYNVFVVKACIRRVLSNNLELILFKTCNTNIGCFTEFTAEQLFKYIKNILLKSFN